MSRNSLEQFKLFVYKGIDEPKERKKQMATRKKTVTESETLKSHETVAAAPRAALTRKPAAESATSSKKTAKATTPAATHKSSARKSTAAEKVEIPVFDLALHHDEVSLEAYHNWLRRGCPHGSEHEDWLAAVATVRARHSR